MIRSSVSKSTIGKILDPLRILILRRLILRRLIFRYIKIKYWGLSVFIIRKIDYREDIVPEILSILERTGFLILINKKLDKQEIISLKNKTPKYKWNNSVPDILIVAYDPLPVATISTRIKILIDLYPDLDNARLLIKHNVRRKINESLESDNRGKHFHATDNSYEALDYINAIDKSMLLGLKENLLNNFDICLECGEGYKFISKCNTCNEKNNVN